ncbi:MAG: nicotinate-nucleotide--dimethylbenzimidazole phosphoribosyltransferase [Thermodesulfobacteriota bacterium]
MKELQEIVQGIRPADRSFMEKAKERTSRLVMPPRALGRLHDMAEKLCGIEKTERPETGRKAVLIFAGDHGVAADGVSAFPQEVTVAMVSTFLAGGAGINAMARHAGAEVFVVDMGVARDLDPAGLPNAGRLRIMKVDKGTKNFTREPAMTRDQARDSVLRGFEAASRVLEEGYSLLGTGDMGIGNTTPSAAIGMCVTGASADEMAGRGTGIDDRGLSRKKEAIETGLALHRPDSADGLDVLSKVGGFEIGGIAGCILAAAYRRKPVVVDGFISTAGALIAAALCPASTDYMFAGHVSEEPGHRIMLRHLGLSPALDLGMRLGEGTGAALAMSLLDAAARMHREVMTFEEAGIPG